MKEGSIKTAVVCLRIVGTQELTHVCSAEQMTETTPLADTRNLERQVEKYCSEVPLA